MKKTFIYFLLCFLLGFNLKAQENVFIVVDVSKSVKQSELLSAKSLVNDLLTGNEIDNTLFYVDGNISRNALLPGSRIMIMPFGDKSTIMNYVPNIDIVHNPSEINSFIDQNFPIIPKDNWTYISLAKARVAEIANKKKIDDYTLIFISDNISDDFGGKPDYSVYEQALVDNYNTQNNPVIEKPGVRIKLKSNNTFSVFIQQIDVSGYNPPSIGNEQSIDSISIPLKIEFTTFKGGTVSKPILSKEKEITISWICRNAPKNAKYIVKVRPIKISGQKPRSYTVVGNSYKIDDLANGKWKIVVSSDRSSFKASSATTTIEVKVGNSLWVLWLLLIPVIGYLVYLFWKKKRNQKLQKSDTISM